MKERDSNFELLRLCAMLFIVIYHLLHFYIIPYSNSSVLKALCIPLHQGVILFVLISGYYGIRVSITKIAKFILPVFLYYVTLSLMDYFLSADRGKIFNCFLFISKSPYWFVRSYLWLLLTSPLINTFLYHAKEKVRVYVLFVLGAISIWNGITGGDPSIDGGKNLINFYFLYSLGNEIKKRQLLCKACLRSIAILYVAVNITVVVSFSFSLDRFYYSEFFYSLFFKYNSLFLIFDACVLFFLFNNVRFQSRLINRIAVSCFPIYLITEHRIVHKYIIEPVVSFIYERVELWGVFCFTILFSIVLSLFCVLIDSLMMAKITDCIFKLIHSIVNREDKQ